VRNVTAIVEKDPFTPGAVCWRIEEFRIPEGRRTIALVFSLMDAIAIRDLLGENTDLFNDDTVVIPPDPSP